MNIFLFSFLLIGLIIKFNFITSFSIFGDKYIEKDIPKDLLAKKYCDSLKQNLFTGLDNELTLKYEYFFSSIPKEFIQDEEKFLEIFKSDVKSICSYEISSSNEKEFNSFLKNYFRNRNNTPKIKVEARNPIPTKPAIIPVFR